MAVLLAWRDFSKRGLLLFQKEQGTEYNVQHFNEDTKLKKMNDIT